MPSVLSKTSLTAEVQVPPNSNRGLTCPNGDFLTRRLGKPRDSFSQECQPVTHPTLKAMMRVTSVGPFRVQGLNHAVESLTRVLRDIASERPEVYQKLGTAGMLCCRFQRPGKGGGVSTKLSSHSWGTAVDLKLAGQLDIRGNGTTLHGIALIAPIFNRHGWFWGATFRTEDAMHFEVSREKLTEWFPDNLYDLMEQPSPSVALQLGSQGDVVRALQQRLQQWSPEVIVDGVFGATTKAAVVRFQSMHGLKPDGIVGPRTRRVMGL